MVRVHKQGPTEDQMGIFCELDQTSVCLPDVTLYFCPSAFRLKI